MYPPPTDWINCSILNRNFPDDLKIAALPFFLKMTPLARMTNLGKSGVVSPILMDLSKAFDCLPHDLISAKLHAYGLDSGSVKVLEIYLSNRYQRTKVDSTLSSWLKVLLLVPQGSVLRPFSFNIFLNDLLLSIKEREICNFANDNTLWKCVKSTQEVLVSL